MEGESVDEVCERSTVKFEPPITLEQAESLLGYVCMMLPAVIHYDPVRHFRLSPPGGDTPTQYQDRPAKIRRGVSLSGDIKHEGGKYEFASFVCQRDHGDHNMISSLNFTTGPGQRIGEYRPETLQLWDDVKRLVAQYFADNRRQLSSGG